ncbi:hypothetical protein [Halobellus litoreus]|jgi:hypothetical protein|uniref:Uncharacterized protein n=1 Tax=Halobellus litoreus TaxID=755310 RepID=A0ABD6DVY8_9EURY|nr:hypothetical protein [Halobellus litoreus]
MSGSDSLEWPEKFDRTPSGERRPYPHNFRVDREDAMDKIHDELRKMGVENARVETGGASDPGVVVYFTRDGQDFAVPCDRWDNRRDNAQAIAKYLDAKRALDRYGVTTVESEFSTAALRLTKRED